MSYPHRGEVYLLDFNPSADESARHYLPVLVVQNDISNRTRMLTIVASITHDLRVAQLPVGVRIEPQDSGLPHPAVVNTGQLYTVHQRYLTRYMSTLPQQIMDQVEKALRVSLGLEMFRLEL